MGKNNMMRKKAGGKMSKYRAKGGIVKKMGGGKMSKYRAKGGRIKYWLFVEKSLPQKKQTLYLLILHYILE